MSLAAAAQTFLSEECSRFKKIFPEKKIRFFARCERIFFSQNVFEFDTNLINLLILHQFDQFVDGHGVYHHHEQVAEKKS